MAQYAIRVPENGLRDLGVSDDAWVRWYLTNYAPAPTTPLPSSIAGVGTPSSTTTATPVPASAPAPAEPSTNLGSRVSRRGPASAATLLADYDQANASRSTRRTRKNFLADAAPISLLGA